MAGRKCPECGVLWPGDAAFCGHCGAELKEEPAPAEPAPENDDGGGGVNPLLVFLDTFPGLLSPKVMALSIAALVVAVFVTWLGLTLFFLGGMIAAFFIGGSGVVVYWCALSWILYGHICNPLEAMADFQQKHWLAFAVLTLLPLGVLFFLVKITRG